MATKRNAPPRPGRPAARPSHVASPGIPAVATPLTSQAAETRAPLEVAGSPRGAGTVGPIRGSWVI